MEHTRVDITSETKHNAIKFKFIQMSEFVFFPRTILGMAIWWCIIRIDLYWVCVVVSMYVRVCGVKNSNNFHILLLAETNMTIPHDLIWQAICLNNSQFPYKQSPLKLSVWATFSIHFLCVCLRTSKSTRKKIRFTHSIAIKRQQIKRILRAETFISLIHIQYHIIHTFKRLFFKPKFVQFFFVHFVPCVWWHCRCPPNTFWNCVNYATFRLFF